MLSTAYAMLRREAHEIDLLLITHGKDPTEVYELDARLGFEFVEDDEEEVVTDMAHLRLVVDNANARMGGR